MSRISKIFRALGIIIRNPWKLNLILNENEAWEKYVRKKYGFMSLPVVPLSHFIRGEVKIEPFAFLDGGSLPTDLALLKQLATDIKDCRYFEIGTWRGESVTNVARSASICYTLNLTEEDLKTHLNDPDFLASQALFSQNQKNITHLFGDSRHFNFQAHGPFDLIFIDGDHHFESIINDTKKVLQYLCHENTIVVWHDYAYNPEQIRYETMAAIFNACPVSLHRFIYHVENTNCAVLYKKDLPVRGFKKYALPDHHFSLKLKILPLNASPDHA